MFDVKNLSPALGAEITCPDLSQPLDDAVFARVHGAHLYNIHTSFCGCGFREFLTPCRSGFVDCGEARMDRFGLGYFGNRRLEKGGSFCTSGWSR